MNNNIPFCLGSFVPLTLEGNIVVDGILASCYPSVDHDLVHFAMTPMQWFPVITGWIFGEDTGYQVYVGITKQLAKWFLPHVAY